jgi:hypothetical protein
MKLLIAIALFSLNYAHSKIPDLRPLFPQEETVRDDLQKILTKADLLGVVDLNLEKSLSENTVRVSCEKNKVQLNVRGGERWAQTFYMGLQKLGFLFPHPRLQVSPDLKQMKKKCGKTFEFRPALKYAGFHFHTLHPNEWVHGFLMGDTEIAMDTVRWLARNQQNIFDLVLLKQNKITIWKNLREPFALAKKFGIHAGVTAGFSMQQQNIYKFISLLGTFSDRISMRQLNQEMNYLLDNVDVSFIDLKMGTSEFTPVNYPRMLKWLNKAGKIAKEKGVALVVKVHVSINQHEEPYGNFNFLPQYATSEVGILPHTVYLYGLADERVRMYGNKDFKHILDFMLQEKEKRRTWFYPETSYFIALDIDTGLLLTDYLLTRSSDMKILYENGIEGQLNFTTGQEMGYWLIDWTVALMNNLDYNFDPMIGIKLLGEDPSSWKRFIDYQHEFFKKKHLLGIVTFQNFGDEIAGDTHVTLERNPLKVLNERPDLIEGEIQQLREAISAFPSGLIFKNRELELMAKITRLRLDHALSNRLAFLEPKAMETHLKRSVEIRKEAQVLVNELKSNFRRYPTAKTWEQHVNPTAYPWGYAYGVGELHYWFREEEVIRQKNFCPFFMNITDWWDIIT